MSKRKELAKKIDREDIKTVHRIMQKYKDINPQECENFLQEELEIDQFFRQLQSQVTVEHISEKHGTGDNGGFFLFNPGGRRTKIT